jgi:hypothetical protein
MTAEDFNWQTAPISGEDQALVDAYERLGVPLDALAYTPEFRELAKSLGIDSSQDPELRKVYLRLLTLRKRGLLPRQYHGSTP